MSTPDFVPTSDRDVKQYVRVLTDYDENPDEYPEPQLDAAIEIAKLELYNRVDDDSFYSDSGLGQALVAGTAIIAKLGVENYSVTRWRIGDQEMETTGFQNPEQAQLSNWNEMVKSGLQSSDATPDYAPSNTASYIRGWD